MNNITILGKTASAISMIADNMEGKPIGSISIINNLGIPDDLPYKNPRFKWAEYGSIQDHHHSFIIGSTDQKIKQKIFEVFKIDADKFINCLHDSAQISSTSKLGKGIIVNSLASIAGHSTIGNFVTINRNASVGHHSTIGDFSTICPSATICGKVKIGRGSFIGAGAVIRDGISIGDNCIIGAGSIVVKDVPDGHMGYGNPFKGMLISMVKS